MPTYQYACRDADCGNQFELVQSFTDPNASQCPECSGPVRKVFSAVGVVFKGSGFYRNDSRSSGEKSAKKADSVAKTDGASKSADSGSSASGDSKSAASASASSSSSSGPSGSSGGSSSSVAAAS